MRVIRDSAEWRLMWDRLEKDTGVVRDFTCPNIAGPDNTHCGEGWGYMHSEVKDGFVVHVFRHRCGFGHQERRYHDVVASEHFEASALQPD